MMFSVLASGLLRGVAEVRATSPDRGQPEESKVLVV